MSNVISGVSGHYPALNDVTNAAHSSQRSSFGAPSVPGMQISGNNTVNIYFSQVSSQAQSLSYTVSPKRKRHRAIIEDSDEEQ